LDTPAPAGVIYDTGLSVTAFEVDNLVAQDERQWLNGRSTQWDSHTVSGIVNQSSAVVLLADHCDPGNDPTMKPASY